ncbi:phage major tail tube protein [Photobacterium leiognathi]|uniref:phage major tail tube protein n=1 Tax=Photobacterium leiognathi TaxID=553611 RepID=UPI002981DC52|nr:phage major tail tube protein [Photobacterium leiognathi]
MADRIRMRITAQVESVPLMNEIIDFTPPEVKAKLANNEGAFVASEDTVGLEKLNWILKVKGEHGVLSRSLGRYTLGNAQINVVEKGKSTGGIPYVETYSMYGPITAIKKEPVKMGDKPTISIEGTCKAYTQYDTGILVHDINVSTGKTVIGGTDLMKLASII